MAKRHVAANLSELDEARPFRSADQPGSVDLRKLAQAASTSTIVKWVRGGGTGSPSTRSPSRYAYTSQTSGFWNLVSTNALSVNSLYFATEERTGGLAPLGR